MINRDLSGKQLKKWPHITHNALSLNLDDNQLTEIPDEIGQLKFLSNLYVGGNRISKISLEICDLKNLKYLIFRKNKIESLPEAIGNLMGLVTLDISENPIFTLPESILNCTSLTHFDFSDTGLPIPDNFDPKEVAGNIAYVLENQKEPAPSQPISSSQDDVNIGKAYIFKNFSKPLIISSFDAAIEELSKRVNVDFEAIDNESIDKPNTLTIIIVGFDSHENKELVFDVIKSCQTKDVPYEILFQENISGIEYVNLEKNAEFTEVHKRLKQKFESKISYFKTDEELKDLMLAALQAHTVEVKLIKLQLTNIGHFERVDVPLNDQLTCLIGENGQGKSSVLKALCLAIIGTEGVDQNDFKSLLRIKSVSDKGITSYYSSGKIRLEYSVDAEKFYNEIELTPKDEGRVVVAEKSGDFNLNLSEFNLKSLIVGFSQLRGRISHTEVTNKYTRPHIDDLLPLVKSTDDTRLDSFVGWIANLHGQAVKSSKAEESKEAQVIKYVFELISELTGKEMTFVTVQQFSPPIVIVSSPNSPKGIPLHLISQGFKIVIGWIGYFIQRKIESSPLAKLEDIAGERAILIIDEIDSSIHPVWQARLFRVLRKKFPNTQIICTTHSPLMVAGLDRQQILEIKNTDGRLSIEQCPFDTWVSTYLQILTQVFETKEFKPVKTLNELEYLSKKYPNDPEKQQEIAESIERLNESMALTDSITQYEQQLVEREKELDALIAEYAEKAAK
ncbi:MAG: hypothetical protein COA42_16810 [Alteromonadaceae bacterium]|nr:MAG: hypothetical protein COA42_16810 [Alteromonadaceae bacterium]